MRGELSRQFSWKKEERPGGGWGGWCEGIREQIGCGGIKDWRVVLTKLHENGKGGGTGKSLTFGW